MLRGLFIFSLSALIFFHWAYGEELDKYSKEALDKTEQLLKDKNSRDQAVKKDPRAKQADKHLQDVMGSPELTQQAYELSAEILKDEANKNGGDASRMTTSIKQADQDPEAWAHQLKPEQLQKIRDMARQIEERQKKMLHQSD